MADLEAMLAPLGQPVLKAAPWGQALMGLLDQDPACLLVDARHDRAVGFEVVHRLRGHARARHLPLLLLCGASAYGQSGLSWDGGLERVDCLFEPMPPDLLRAKVGMCIRLHQRERAARSALDRAGRIEAAAHERERMLNTLLGNLPVMVYRCLIESDYPMVYVSEGALSLTGYSREDFLARRVLWEDLIHPDDVPRVWDDVGTALSARKPFTLTYRLRTRTGEERWVWGRGVEIQVAGSAPPMLEGFITDITALKHAEMERERLLTEVEAERRRLEAILQQVPCGLYVAEAPSGRTLLANAQAEQLLGYPLLKVQSIKEFARYHAIHPDGRPYTAEEYPIARVLSTGKAQTGVELLYRQPDGSWRTLHLNAGPVRDRQGVLRAVVASFMDITARKRTELHQALLSSLGALFGSTLDYEVTLTQVVWQAVPELGDACMLDVVEPDGTLRRMAAHHVDPAQVELLYEVSRSGALRLDSPIGPGAVIRTGQASLLSHVTDDMLVRYASNATALALLRRFHIASVLIVPLHARGRTFGALTFMYCSSGRHFGPETQPLAEEVARRAALALDNARLYREARRAVKLRDDFLSVASHELKTPLTPLNLKLTALFRELQPWEREAWAIRFQHHLEMARRQVHKMTTLINALLDISHLSQGELALRLEQTDLGELLREVTDWFAPEAARAGSELHVEGEAHVRGRWDRLRLEQVITNLLSNAIRYGAGRPIHVRTEAEGDRVRLVVRDQGAGIPPEAQARLFDKFGKFERSPSERHAGGLGLGLYITRRLVEALGGHIRMESRLGEGSTFTVELPRSPPADARR
ncbi:PAS domain-containing protein [Archangium gephyra]|nr:PAS domain-containing protein [Archangium gephyra]